MTAQSDCVKRFTLSELESHLWEAANILRGPVDAADFKTYVFPLLFLKSLSDTYDEEYHAALKESGGDVEFAQFSQNYRFKIPESARWTDVRSVTSNVGQALQKAMRSIEKANPNALYGIFGDAQWTNKERLSDSLLRDLIEHFSCINLGNQSSQDDMLGHGRITNTEYQKAFGVSKPTASRNLNALLQKRILIKVGQTGKGTYYILNLQGLTKGSSRSQTAHSETNEEHQT
ncbi:MAG: type I restriction-modification system subunit M N-terminal domain-containing protein [Methanothrix sp.]